MTDGTDNRTAVHPIERVEVDRLLAFVSKACEQQFLAELRIQVGRAYGIGYDDGMEDERI